MTDFFFNKLILPDQWVNQHRMTYIRQNIYYKKIRSMKHRCPTVHIYPNPNQILQILIFKTMTGDEHLNEPPSALSTFCCQSFLWICLEDLCLTSWPMNKDSTVVSSILYLIYRYSDFTLCLSALPSIFPLSLLLVNNRLLLSLQLHLHGLYTNPQCTIKQR